MEAVEAKRKRVNSEVICEDFSLVTGDGKAIGGRRIGESSSSRTIVYFHGFPGSRVEATLAYKSAIRRNVSVIAFDRPGIGLTEYRAASTFVAVAALIDEALRQLSIQHFDIIAVSGGSPYAIALARLAGSRVGKCALVSPLWEANKATHLKDMAWPNRMFIKAGQRFPTSTKMFLTVIAYLWRRFPMLSTAWFGAVLPSVDRKILSRKSVAPIMNDNLVQALAAGTRGVVDEFVRFSSLNADWTTDMVEATSRVWHGTEDNYVPLSMAEAISQKLSRGELKIVEGGGHFMMIDILEEVFDWCTTTHH